MSIAALLERSAQLHGDRVAIVDGERELTYASLANRVACLAGALLAKGLQPGDRVAILALNSHRYVETLFAVSWAGGISAPLNYRLSEPEIASITDFVEARFLIADDSHAVLAGRLTSVRPNLVLIHTSDASADDGALCYERLIETANPVPAADCRWDETAALFFTGGTTGLPKGVMQTHGNLVTSALIYVGLFGMSHDTVLLSAAGLFHVAASAVLLPALMAGGRVVLMARFTPEGYLDMIERHGATFVNGVPTMLRLVANVPDRAQRRLDSVRTLLYGGAPMQRDIIGDIVETFPNARCFNTYGQTELTSAASISAGVGLGSDLDDSDGWASIGHALPGMEIRIVADDGAACAGGATGEIEIRGPLVMKGYWNNPEATANAMRGDWLRTGDLGRVDTAGRAFLVDRKKDMIITGGENVYSAEVEAVLRSHPEVDDCAVVGVPDSMWGERVHAIVVVAAGRTPDGDTLIRHCRSRLAGYKCPRSIELRTEPLPLSGAGKVAKATLRAEVIERLS